MIIYVDILFIINFFITYVLLSLTSLLLKQRARTVPFLIASAVGGFYSLVMLVERLNFLLTASGKLFASLLIVFIAFGFGTLSRYIKALVIFYFSNMLLLGVITALILIFKPDGLTINNSVVYFDVSAKMLLLAAFFAYVASSVIIRIYNRTVAKKEVYSITIEKGEESYRLYAFADSGNKLREPFSDYPVVIVDENKVSAKTERVIPYNTVGGEGMLKAFKPDRLIISNGTQSFQTDRVYVALSNVDSKDFSAIINPQILNIR